MAREGGEGLSDFVEGGRAVAGDAASWRHLGLPLAVSATLLCASLVACAGSPSARSGMAPVFSRLGTGASAYVVCDVAAVRPILEAADQKIAEDRKVSDLLDRTKTAEIALFEGDRGKYRVFAVGRYPRFLASLSMAFRRSWKRVGSGDPYWLSTSGLRLKFLEEGEVLLSDGPFPVSDSIPPEIPNSFRLLEAEAAVRGFIPQPARVVSRALGTAGELIRLPIDELTFSLDRNGASYRIFLRAVVSSPREAQALAAMLRLARLARLQEDGDPRRRLLGKLIASNPMLEGAGVSLRADGIHAAELASLLPELPADALLYP